MGLIIICCGKIVIVGGCVKLFLFGERKDGLLTVGWTSGCGLTDSSRISEGVRTGLEQEAGREFRLDNLSK
jgi:hypothetical protein